MSGVQLTLSTSDGVNKYTATFDQGTSITVSCNDNMLELELTQPSAAQGTSKGLLGKLNEKLGTVYFRRESKKEGIKLHNRDGLHHNRWHILDFSQKESVSGINILLFYVIHAKYFTNV